MKNFNLHVMVNNSKSMFVLLALAIVWSSCSDETELAVPDKVGADKGKTGAYAAPSVSCVSATQASITVKVTAGSTGAPAGFSLQWITKEALDANNGIWPLDETLFCKAGFSGNASGYAYNLTASGETSSAEVTIGAVLYETPGASSECVEDLSCGSQYVFRAFAHATSTMNKSPWSSNQTCSTLACGVGCVYGQGYWKNNPEIWPVDELTLGLVTYTKEELLSILAQPANPGNGLIILAKQLIAAKLNIAKGADGSSVEDAIEDADDLIGELVVPPVGSGTLDKSLSNPIKNLLEAFNDPEEQEAYCTESED